MVTVVTPCEFTDADLTHPWATKWRIPLVATPYPRWFYEVALVVPRGEFEWLNVVWPTDDEAEIIGSYIDYRRDYYRESHQRKMLARALDVDGSTNTVILAKTEAGWRYRCASWTSGGLWPYLDNADQQANYPPTRAGLIEIIRHAGRSSLLDEWIAAHPIWTKTG